MASTLAGFGQRGIMTPEAQAKMDRLNKLREVGRRACLLHFRPCDSRAEKVVSLPKAWVHCATSEESRLMCTAVSHSDDCDCMPICTWVRTRCNSSSRRLSCAFCSVACARMPGCWSSSWRTTLKRTRWARLRTCPAPIPRVCVYQCIDICVCIYYMWQDRYLCRESRERK